MKNNSDKKKKKTKKQIQTKLKIHKLNFIESQWSGEIFFSILHIFIFKFLKFIWYIIEFIGMFYIFSRNYIEKWKLFIKKILWNI